MMDWTNSAKTELERYCARVRESLAGSGADAAEVIDDLKRHVEAEVVAAQLRVVTEEDVRRILARIGDPAMQNEKPLFPVEVTRAAESQKPKRKKPGYAVLIFGIILPLVSLSIEVVTRMCASTFFDPMPTIWHVLLVTFVPLANLAAWIGVRERKVAWRRRLGLANGFAIGIAAYYALLYLPLMLPGLFAIIFFGWGLLPLSPFFCMIAVVVLRAHLRRLGSNEEPKHLPGLGWGLAGAVAVVAVLALPAPVTRHLSKQAVSDSPAEAANAIHWLRAIGSEETLLADCYGNGSWRGDMPFDWRIEGRPVDQEQAQAIYFRVTGRPFNAQPPPHPGHHSRGWAFDDFDWDNGLGGEAVAGCLKGLSLHSSRVDGIVEPDGALGYYEWTMEFKNVAAVQREARAQILLPPGAVVSRLTLWVNGEEREAAFGGRSQVRAAYQEVAVRQRRDPVLVTTCGPDRVLMQCFPVPPDGGLMKIRVGITMPMLLEKVECGTLRWPVFLERNFSMAEEFKHSVWIESKELLETKLKALRADQPKTGQFVLRGDLTDRELNEPEASVLAQCSGKSPEVWASCEEGSQVVRQRIVEKNEPAPSRIVVVVDGSQSMQEFVPDIAAALRQMPDGVECAFYLASDEASTISNDLRKGNHASYEELAKRFQKSQMTGGQDNIPSLWRAWDLAAESKDGAVLWIHGPQPVLLEGADGLRQRFERRPGSPKLYEIQTKTGPNRVAEKLDGLGSVVSLPRLGKLEADLTRLFSGWSGRVHTFGFARELVERASLKDLPNLTEASKHVARLWAYENVLQLAGSRQLDKAMALVSSVHLVTPVSGAVVLETKAQFDQAGLTPADATKVPVIPEPGTWALLLLGAVLIGARCCWRRFAKCHGDS
jgi:hypothetical protein